MLAAGIPDPRQFLGSSPLPQVDRILDLPFHRIALA
jgi:hypothetical protein